MSKKQLANPQNYDAKGAVKKGSKKWVRTKSWHVANNQANDIQRRLAARRKQLHGNMINRIVRDSARVSTEKLSYKSFQKQYDKSINVRAPASFETRLQAKILVLGGEFQLINTYTTRLSQTCICGTIHKKPRSQRWHTCPVCHTVMQRDLFSAFLALSVTNDTNNVATLDCYLAKTRYPRYQPVLQQAITDLKTLKKTKPNQIVKTFGI